MSTVYFTNNADSGDGSLRDAITNCAAGDTISPQGFAEGDITILLGSYLPTKSFTLDAGENNRIILDGQGTSDFFRIGLAATEITFNKVTFQNGVRDSSAPFYASAFTSLTFNRCAFLNNTGANAGFMAITAAATGQLKFDSCVAFGNKSSAAARAGVLYIPLSSTATAAVTCCTFGGTNSESSDIRDGGQATVVDSIIERLNDTATDLSACKFVDSINGDYRLTSASPDDYFTKGTSEGVDFYGRARLGTIGAYSGSWFVVKSTVELYEDCFADYGEFAYGSAVYFSDKDVILNIANPGKLDNVFFEAFNNCNGYVAFPQGTNTENCAYIGVTECYNGNFITSVTYDGEAIVFESTSPESPVLLEVKDDDKWEVVTNALISPYRIVVSKDTEYRLFDGHSFQNVTIVAPASYYEIAEAYTLGYIQ